MRNDELYSPSCPDARAKKLVNGYVLRGLAADGTYPLPGLLARQHAVYLEWLAAMRERRPKFDCGFHEWMSRSCDSAFVFRPNDLVKYGGRYHVVVRRCPRGVDWEDVWRLRNGMPSRESWPRPASAVELKDPDGRALVVDALAAGVEPADIPPEVFSLACGKAKGCPMMKGGAE